MSLKFESRILKNSLQWRITLFFSGAMLLILCVVSALLYREFNEQVFLRNQIDFIHVSKTVKDALNALSNGENTSEQWQQTWNKAIEADKRLRVKILTPEGETYLQSKGWNFPSAAFPPSSVFTSSRKPVFKPFVDQEQNHFLVTAFGVTVGSARTWQVRATLNTSRSKAVMVHYRNKLLMILLVAFFITIAISWRVAAVGLLPLYRINSEIVKISPESLSTRIGTQPWPKELATLASSFDTMLERLETAFTELSRFSDDLAHEVRTPVNNMLTAASVTLARQREVPDYQKALDTIVEEAERLILLVDNMLFIARTENRKEAMVKEKLSAAREFSLQIDFFDAFASEKNVQIFQEGDLTFVANPILFRRALSNLISNALNYAPSGSIVHLKARSGSNEVLFSVQDDGTGIAEEHLPHLFERFYCVDSSRSDAKHTGLGLAIVQSIANAHGGSVSVSSTLGEGATFVLSLPKG